MKTHIIRYWEGVRSVKLFCGLRMVDLEPADVSTYAPIGDGEHCKRCLRASEKLRRREEAVMREMHGEEAK